MNNNIKVFIISLKGSKRLPIIKKRLNELKIKFIVIDGINGINYFKQKKLHLIFDQNKTLKNINRNMSPSEIGAAASHIKTYKYIVKNNIDQAIIFEDDVYPSKKMSEWIKKKIKVNNDKILSFYAYPSGFFKKKPERVVLNSIGIHNGVTHLYNNSCYQINKHTAKKILKITKGKVIGYADWPFNTFKHNITCSLTLPYMAIPNDRGMSYLSSSRDEILGGKKNFFKTNLPEIVYKKFLISFYLLFIPFFFRKYKNFYFYIEHFFLKNFYELINMFTGFYFDQKKLFFKENLYCKDLSKQVRSVYKNIYKL